MSWNDIVDEVATLRAIVLSDCDLYPTTDYGLGAVSGTLYASEEYLVSADLEQASQLISRYWPDIHHTQVLRIGDLTLFSIEDPIVCTAMLTLEHNHD